MVYYGCRAERPSNAVISVVAGLSTQERGQRWVTPRLYHPASTSKCHFPFSRRTHRNGLCCRLNSVGLLSGGLLVFPDRATTGAKHRRPEKPTLCRIRSIRIGARLLIGIAFSESAAAYLSSQATVMRAGTSSLHANSSTIVSPFRSVRRSNMPLRPATRFPAGNA